MVVPVQGHGVIARAAQDEMADGMGQGWVMVRRIQANVPLPDCHRVIALITELNPAEVGEESASVSGDTGYSRV